MKQFFPFLFMLGIGVLNIQTLRGHSHTTYIVEQPATVVIAQPQQIQAPYVVVESAPPAEVEEDMGACPGFNYAWVRGRWQWNGVQWIRVHGHWQIKPQASSIWVPGCWKEHHHHWKWVEGYWQ